MVVQLMQTSSPPNQLNKVVSSTKQYDVVLKGQVDVLRPVIIVTESGVLGYNYMYVPDFGRYYFLGTPTTRNEGTVEIECKVDPLMSWKSDILTWDAVIERNENIFMKYITDSKYTVLNYERIQTKTFPNSFPNTGEFVLVVAGS